MSTTDEIRNWSCGIDGWHLIAVWWILFFQGDNLGQHEVLVPKAQSKIGSSLATVGDERFEARRNLFALCNAL